MLVPINNTDFFLNLKTHLLHLYNQKMCHFKKKSMFHNYEKNFKTEWNILDVDY